MREINQEQLMKDISDRIKKIRTYTPKVGVFGNSGVGKSSLCNALFGKDIAKISDVEACTRKPQEILIGGTAEFGKNRTLS
ncbi:50S ribosome-binding GTPase [Aeromonas hydrophila]|uniref:GTPase n=1 Tax=Aeromonas hydrophila TaxID=644 RepID=UPI0023797322|nr:GTPase [Aeromonas hydrophila]MDD9232520.1 50S ribosome-binding GTPase [Aeromonas hydrophila]